MTKKQLGAYIMNAEKENLLKKMSTLLLWIGCICGIISVVASFINKDWLIFISGVITIPLSIIGYAFYQVVAEISISLKKENEEVKCGLSSNKDAIIKILKVVEEIKLHKASPEKKEVKTINSTEAKVEPKINIEIQKPKKEYNEFIAEEHSDFKSKLAKWEVLKKRGFIEQAIKEYEEYTGLERNDAIDFINSL